MLCLSGFELYSRWVPVMASKTMTKSILQLIACVYCCVVFSFMTNFIPSGGLALPYFAGLFYQVRFHDGGEWHEGAPRTCWHWSCASTFGKNPWKTPNVEYYTLTKVGSAPKTVQDAYLKVLGKRKEDVNFKKQVICSMRSDEW